MLTETGPTRTVTFLFTDIEGSTRLWELYPEPMRAVLAQHDALLREAVGAHQGRIVKTTGDGCHAVFETAVSAVGAALAAQQALREGAWTEIRPEALRVRMGVHTGEAEARDGDFFGPAVNRAARLTSVGYGGQVLVSAVSALLVREGMPAGAALLDLGEHRLKDLVAPEHIFQLAHPALPAGFPPLKSLDAYPNNLPVQLTSFIGREREIEEGRRLLSQSRLVTLTGSGGTGKTRLALQLAAECLPDFADGAWLVELAPVTDPAGIVPALAGALELRTAPGLPLVDLVTNHLRGKRTLIVLDNCEHLIDACARLADHLLRICPVLRILASSREGLGIAGEASYRVPSLSLPELEASTIEGLARSEAAQLFLERACAANRHFALTSANAQAVAQICHRLDGIPLALELAAARAKLFSAEQIATRLDDRFRLLTGGSRVALPRQQTLRALIDWSYDLLSEAERALLRRLSVFAGGWTFEAADAVCAELDVLGLLEQLINKSLVVTEENQGQSRYHMLETVRQYAREKLMEAGEVATLRDRHFDYFLKLSEEAEPGLRVGPLPWLDRLARDYDNLGATIDWGQGSRPEETLRLMGNLLLFLGFGINGYQQPLHWLKRLLPKVEAPAGNDPASKGRLHARARGLSTVGMLNMELGDHPAAVAAFSESIPLERRLGDPFYLSLALGTRAYLALVAGDDAAGHPAAEEAVTLMHSLADRRWVVICLPFLAAFESRAGHEDRAAQLRREANLYLDQADHPMFMAALNGLGEDARDRHELDEAQMYFERGLALARQFKSRPYINVMESELAHLLRMRGRLSEAKTAYRRLIGIWKEFGHFSAVAHQLECFGFIALADHDPQRAVHLLGAAEVLREGIHIPMTDVERVEYDGAVAALRAQLGADAFAAAWAQGRSMDIERAIQYAVTPVELAKDP